MKKWYASKTVWLNLLAVAAFAVQLFTGDLVPLEYQAGAIAIANFALRFATSQGIEPPRLPSRAGPPSA